MAGKLLLISNSTMAGEEYLGWPKQFIGDFLKKYGVRRLTFVPYAGVGLSQASLQASYDVYLARISSVFSGLGVAVESVHQAADPVAMIKNAESVAVGGGNTFHLVAKMQEYGVMNAIRQKVLDGTPYMGWSAGANVACPTMMTTNDMPIAQPLSFHCLGVVPFQINPHYLDANPVGHGGETRQQRIEEYLIINRHMRVLGLREASLLEVDGNKMTLLGSRPLREFSFGNEPKEYEPGSDLSHLL
jgi:dipeptidase E